MNANSLSQNYPVVPLGDHAKIESGYAFRSADWCESGIPVVKITSISGGRLSRDGLGFVDTDTARKAQRFNLKHGDVLVAMTGASLGSMALVQRDDVPLLLNQRVGRIVATSKHVDDHYLYFVLSSGVGSEQLINLGHGSAQPNLSSGDFGRIQIPLPSLVEQRAIAGVLGALDDKIESNRRQQSTLLGICHAAFDVALMNGADVMKVEDMVRFRNNERKPLSAMERAGMERRYPYYGATGVFDYVEAFLFDDVNILIGEDGSVVNDDGTPVAQMAWGKYWVNNHAHVLSGKAVSTELAYIALARSDVRPLITGAVQLKINMGNLRSLEVELPSVEVRGDVDHEIQENLALWRAKSDESKMLVGLRDALLPELLSGRLRVKDAESMMENV
jgi:type I restriction enzyme S subunit